jgi:hypothetical protein
MERAGTTPQTIVDASDLAGLADGRGPFLTVHLTTDARIDNAAQRSEQRWRALRDHAAAQGTPEEVLAAVDPLVADAHLEGQTLAVVATEEGVVHVEHPPGPPTTDLARWAPLPSLIDVIRWRQELPPYVTVLVDRQGADLAAYRCQGLELETEAGGDDYPLRKPNAGGWSQRRYEERAEHTWERNAADAAEQVSRLADRVGARLVIAAGDERALVLLRQALPTGLVDRFQVVGGGRGADGSDESFEAQVQAALALAVNADTEAALEKFREELGQDDRASDGPAATLGALTMAAVDVLLVAPDDPQDTRTAFFGPDPAVAGATADDVRALGVDQPLEGRLLDVAVRAALGTGAGIRVVPAGATGPSGGMGAILRWSA